MTYQVVGHGGIEHTTRQGTKGSELNMTQSVPVKINCQGGSRNGLVVVTIKSKVDSSVTLPSSAKGRTPILSLCNNISVTVSNIAITALEVYR